MTLYQKKEFKFSFDNREIIIETGRMAKQADGAVFVTCGGTQVLVTAVSATEKNEEQDFLPLLVDYKERFFAAGKLLGSFHKREGRPTNSEILLMRMVDRPFRPLFPEGYFYETIVQANVFSYDGVSDPEVLAGIGAGAALSLSDIPFAGPVGFCKVGKINGKLKLNPSPEEWQHSSIELVVAGTEEAVSMIEGESDEISEADMLEAILFAHDHIKGYCRFMKEVMAAVGKAKRPFAPAVADKTLLTKITEEFGTQASSCLAINPKLERQNAVKSLEQKITEKVKTAPSAYGLKEGDNVGKKIHQAVDELLYKMMRQDILVHHKRIGGRKLTQVRPIMTEIDVLKRVHGSALFTRGETQVLGAVTLGGKDGQQLIDGINGTSFAKFYLHYTFAPFSVGEARGYRGVGRREIGHGNLAERALKKVLPADFPYTVRVCCEVLESNGSSSMGSVCAGSMALMDAAVPLRAPVAGVAMGLIKEEDKFVILTDILGDEDHLGDMDFKVAGTAKGITAIQMDIKIQGIDRQIFEQALTQAHEGRMHILSEMASSITKARPQIKEGVPRIETLKIEPDKIGALIGPSGKNIKSIQERYQLTADIQDDGTVTLLGHDSEKLSLAQAEINLQINGPAIGSIYHGQVVTIKEYGAFVDLAPNVAGLLHVSELTNERVKDINEYLTEGDFVDVKVLEVDRFGKMKLSAKAIKPLEPKSKK